MPLSNGPSQQEPPLFGPSATSHMVGASDESSIRLDTIGKSASLWRTALELRCKAASRSANGRFGSLLNADINSAQAISSGIRAPYAGFTGTVSQALRPYPQHLGINGITSAIGNSVYHAAQFKAQKQFSSGLSFLVGYTISKALTDVDSTPGY